jgi:DMSO/TMAO reductase YedYZ molybdopterin-dependent catalytic subunit
VSALTKTIAQRTPPGQVLTVKWPVLHYSGVPKLTAETLLLRTSGEVDRPLSLSLAALRELPTVRLTSDFHCVTTWSKLDNAWEGVRFSTVAAETGIRKAARYVMAHGADGYYTNIPLRWLDDSDVLLAWSHDGEPLTAEHGGPLRLVVPKLYAWKSAKWLTELEFMANDRRGFWEERGYHNRGEPFSEERYSYQETGEASDG